MEKENTGTEIDWNPWYGCNRISVGCRFCYSAESYSFNRSGFRLPVLKEKVSVGKTKKEKYELRYRIPSGKIINVCPLSDFFIEWADYVRDEAWQIIHDRPDCLFVITTKRPERIPQCLPSNWLGGWDNVVLNVSVEDNDTANRRLPYLLRLVDYNFRHLGIDVAPMLEDLDIMGFIGSGFIDHVEVAGERYYGVRGYSRILELAWVKKLSEQCELFDVSFRFRATGTRLKTEDGQIVDVKFYDEASLAEFYQLNNFDNSVFNTWEAKQDEIESRQLSENAQKIYIMMLKDKLSKCMEENDQ